MVRLAVPRTATHVRRISFVPAPPGRATRQRNYLDISLLEFATFIVANGSDEWALSTMLRKQPLRRAVRAGRVWRLHRPPKNPQGRKRASRSHQLGDLSVAKGPPNGPGTGSQRDYPTPLRLGGYGDVDPGAQGAAGVTSPLGAKTCAVARRREGAAMARNLPRPLDCPLSSRQQTLWSPQELLLSQNSHKVSPTAELGYHKQSLHREEALFHCEEVAEQDAL
ncbi:hypothetical protein HPB50_009936 [Hyalomma asiaticum]|uniref:Uncharacterized protein n=1 Tax=Hyalomma asiaticum TaxID=266040 RepID=A0ACB7SP30_HYAAI|nr:hypothetical protein HPB50_009936 [Hyalomma asiaticum]